MKYKVKPAEVLIVHCIDTEGPMYESLEATFERINKIFQLDIACNKENLRLVQNMELDLNGHEENVRDIVSPKRLSMNETWSQIDNMLNYIKSYNFRNKFKDSFGGGWVYSWFCLDHIGFDGINPRKRDIGHHKVFDHYLPMQEGNDIIQWHYHPLPASGNVNCSGIAYLNSSNIWEILARKIIDRQWFPSVYRPGFHVERPDSHWFLEQWIPFDYANQSVSKENEVKDSGQIDMSNHRYGDWFRATKEWKSYHPSHEDYQVEGHCKRSIFRCLNMEARIREITLNDVENAFDRAAKGNNAVLSFANHDFRDMAPEIDKLRGYIEIASRKYSHVKFRYMNALEAARKHLDLDPSYPDLEITINHQRYACSIDIRLKNEIFGTQPFFCVKTIDDRYIWENLDLVDLKHWSFIMDWNHIDPNTIEKVGIAANSISGGVTVINYCMVTRKKNTYYLN